MLRTEASVDIDRPAEVILEWILDLERYRRADRKITKVVLQEPGRVRYRGRLRGIPTPIDEQAVHHEPGRSLVFRGAPRWTRRVVDFEGGFHCTPIPGGTRVVHRECFGFKPAPVRWIAEAWLEPWLQRDVEAEVGRLKDLVETET
ncbi:MAG TPA: SRPBCC family protein [Microthrixaceae bacterium]|nr:SRPBCC family protein [Microthrixaceae bacterium]